MLSKDIINVDRPAFDTPIYCIDELIRLIRYICAIFSMALCALAKPIIERTASRGKWLADLGKLNDVKDNLGSRIDSELGFNFI